MKKILSIFLISTFLFIISIQNTSARNVDNKVILGGEPFGITMFSQGVIVIKTMSAENKLKPEDVIISADNENVDSSEKMAKIIAESSDNTLELEIIRNDEKINESVRLFIDEQGIKRLGVWIKDSAAGLGTVTFYNPYNDTVCGLGHGICESDTGKLIPLSEGEIKSAYITSVTKSENSKVGSLNGYFTDTHIANAVENRNEGIYGITESEVRGNYIIVADETEINTGKAKIVTTIHGEIPKEYSVEIIKINPDNDTKNLVIRITDKELLTKTGGIVQGMSGSPIIQNGKLVGALTHVLIDSTDTGYGIFAERMLDISEDAA